MFCKNCGSRMPDGSTLCQNCGHNHNDPFAYSQQPMGGFDPLGMQSYTPPKKSSSVNVFAIIAASVMLLMIIFSFLPWIDTMFGDFNIFQLTELGYAGSSLMRGADGIEGVMTIMLIVVIISDMFCVPGIVLAFVKKDRMPMGISVAASVLALVGGMFYLIVGAVGTDMGLAPTAFVVLYVALAVANIVMTSLARNRG
ncbi:MAG: zinc ribbon domain-containing protein [Ruminococcaceae bacterium]|nr:zinc ribbon domain-containing protein [Oscillospiraceae bacterium]